MTFSYYDLFRDRNKVKEMVENVKVKEFTLNSAVIITENETEKNSTEINDDDEILIEEITKLFEENYSSLIRNVNLYPIDFEKDDDTNLHMDFITSCSNLRAENYDIAPTDKHNVKSFI